MTKKQKALSLGTLVGMILTFCISGTIVTGVWGRNTTPVSDARNTVDDYLNLTEQELDKLTEFFIVGMGIDYVAKLLMFVVPSTCFGSGIGLLGGFLWHRTYNKLTVEE